jgi:hypothetical protein
MHRRRLDHAVLILRIQTVNATRDAAVLVDVFRNRQLAGACLRSGRRMDPSDVTRMERLQAEVTPPISKRRNETIRTLGEPGSADDPYCTASI